jgi:hypothetical protein
VTARAPISYDPYLAGRTVERITGEAETLDGGRMAWSAVAKSTSGPGLRAARRELAAYRSGVASSDPAAGLRAPALLGSLDEEDRVEVWLEEIRDDYGGAWPIERFGLAARHIGAWDARMARAGLPAEFDSEDAWAERHGQPERVAEVLGELSALAHESGAQEVAAALDDVGFSRTHRLIESTGPRIELLAGFEQTPLHHDLVRSNLFATGESITLAIDWENVGRGPLGVDMAPLVIGSVRRGEASGDDLDLLESAVLGGYLEGLGALGTQLGDEVRRAYGLAVGLRWHVVLGTISSALDPRSWGFRGSRREEPRAEGLRHLIAVSRYILGRGEAHPL